MNFISTEFFVFFAVLLLILYLTKDYRRQNIVLLFASYLFYFLGDPKFLALLIGVSLLMWILGRIINKNIHTPKAKRSLIFGVVIDVLTLGIFKYFNFFGEGFATLFGMEYTVLHIILPLGLSFYIFQSISYIVDVYTGKIEAEKSMVDVLLYIGFFPQIVSGPIVKAHDFLPQIKKNHSITLKNLSVGMQQFVLGMFKKLVIADRLGVAVNAVYSVPEAYSGFSLLMISVTYSLQIYYDFSGYSDMAIGLAHVIGFDLGKNFNLPYLAKNPSDFWQRWHISLSSWFRDYVYIPLGGSRKGAFRTYLNLFITMLLSGLWHGASWAFVIWGIMHALASVVHKWFVNRKKEEREDKKFSKIYNLADVVITYCSVCLFWIPFRVNDLGMSVSILKRIFTWSRGINYVYVFTLIFAIMLIVVQWLAVAQNKGNSIWKPLNLMLFRNKLIFCLFIMVIACFAYIGDSAFIYAQF